MNSVLQNIFHELKAHAPFTLLGTLSSIGIMAIIVYAQVPDGASRTLFWTLHPLHVLLSAVATTAMYRRHSAGTLWATFLVGYAGSIGIATLSDCIIPYVGEYLLGLPNRGIHLGFIEEWELVNPLAVLGIAVGWAWPKTKIPHAGHVLLSMWASLFHMTMALGGELSVLTMLLSAVFLFLAVWVPCCTSDIVFPLLFAKEKGKLVPTETDHQQIV